MKPIPTVSKNAPLKIDEIEEEYKESKTEKRGKLIFWLGVIFFVFIVVSTFGVYAFWIKS